MWEERKLIKVSLLIVFICIFIFVGLLENMRELHSFRVTHYVAHSSKLQKLKKDKKMVVLSDLHNHVYGVKNQKLVDAIRNIQPDIIIIAGDMIIGDLQSSYQTTFDFVAQLPDICPVYYTNGNHEQRFKEKSKQAEESYQEYQKELEAYGVVFLNNDSKKIYLDNIPIIITGIELPLSDYCRGKGKPFSLSEVKQRIGIANTDYYNLLVSHSPTFTATYKEWGADMVVSGHLHGGIIRIPGFRGVITPQAHLFPKYSGELHREENMWVVISKGLGTHTVNIRLFNPAEIVVVHL